MSSQWGRQRLNFMGGHNTSHWVQFHAGIPWGWWGSPPLPETASYPRCPRGIPHEAAPATKGRYWGLLSSNVAAANLGGRQGEISECFCGGDGSVFFSNPDYSFCISGLNKTRLQNEMQSGRESTRISNKRGENGSLITKTELLWYPDECQSFPSCCSFYFSVLVVVLSQAGSGHWWPGAAVSPVHSLLGHVQQEAEGCAAFLALPQLPGF